MDEGRVINEFYFLVNMTPKELDAWLKTKDAQSVGWSQAIGKITKPGPHKSEGYISGLANLEILSKDQHLLNSDDYRQMRRTIGFIKRHLGQRPNKHIEQTRWRYSLMNWGHDPLK